MNDGEVGIPSCQRAEGVNEATVVKRTTLMTGRVRYPHVTALTEDDLVAIHLLSLDLGVVERLSQPKVPQSGAPARLEEFADDTLGRQYLSL
jgi:hypothetical protein